MDFHTKMQDLVSSTDNWDLLLLYHNKTMAKSHVTAGAWSLFEPLPWTGASGQGTNTGCVAYLLTPQAAQLLLTRLVPMKTHLLPCADYYWQHVWHEMRVLICLPNAVQHDFTVPSDRLRLRRHRAGIMFSQGLR